MPEDSFPDASIWKGHKMHRWLLFLLLISSSAIQLAVTFSPSRITAWEALASDCSNGHACWLGISAATTTAETAELHILQRSGDLLVNESLGQNIQWTHPEGYQGMMLFNRSSVSFLELNFPSTIPESERVRVGDVFLTFGQPDELEHRRNGETVLYYYGRLLIVRVGTFNKSRISPNDYVTTITMPSPYGSWMDDSRQTNRRQAWFGFGTLPATLLQLP